MKDDKIYYDREEDNVLDEDIGMSDEASMNDNDGTCPDCGSIDNIVVDGETICKACGMVIKNLSLNMNPEWRVFTPDERARRERTGSPSSPAIHDRGLSTEIGNITGKVSPEQRERIQRIQKWNKRTRVHSSKDRNLVQAMSELSKLSDKLHIPKATKDQAATIYRQALGKDLVRGRSISAIIAASLYAACRQHRIQRTLTAVSEHSPITKKDIARCYRLILKELNMKMPVPDASAKIPAIASKIGISGTAQQMAKLILKGAKEAGITAGKDPTGIAAAALYISCIRCGEHKTQRVIAKAAGVTEVTIRNRYKGLMTVLDQVDSLSKDSTP